MKKTMLTNETLINVLLIDDHKMVRDGLKSMLLSLNKFYSFKIFEAETAESALSKMSKEKFSSFYKIYEMY